MRAQIYIGTAGWNVPPGVGSQLSRYSKALNCVEINSSFYRDHKKETYAKWASMTPDDFRFSVKLSRYFTQNKRLRGSGTDLCENIQCISGLGKKFGALLIQLPPSLSFEPKVTQKFFKNLRKYFEGNVVWEPRHPTWSAPRALDMLEQYKINKVLANPEHCKIRKCQRPPLEHIRYLRLHGTPQIYKSNYSETTINLIAQSIIHPISLASETWCIFDNTTYGFAFTNACLLAKITPSSFHPALG